jgi:hypothetical protein
MQIGVLSITKDFVHNERKKLGRLPRTSRKNRGNNATHIKEETPRTATHEADLPAIFKKKTEKKRNEIF